MHDLIFASQNEWSGNPKSVDALKRIAAEAGLDSAAFDACLDEGRYEAVVSADLAEGGGLGISGTPTFFINGQRLGRRTTVQRVPAGYRSGVEQRAVVVISSQKLEVEVGG